MERPEVNVNAPALEPLKLTEEEKPFYLSLFKEADKGDLGIITGPDAVQFFGRTQLVSNFLGQLWQMVDVENRGFLTFFEFCQFLRLISHAQHGKSPLTLPLVYQAAALPKFFPQESPAIPPLTGQDSAKYQMQFMTLKPVDGHISGPLVQSILVTSALPADRLGWIWNAAKKDTTHSNFSVDEFSTAMHLVNWFKSRPSASAISPNVTGHRTIPMTSGPGPAPIHAPAQAPAQTPTQVHVQTPVQAPIQVPIQAAHAPPPNLPSRDDLESLFNKLRGDQRYITGEAASNFLERYSLPSEVLADIWDLSDIDSDGNLDKDEFIVAMHLVYTKVASPGQPVPKFLPYHLIPPGKRHLVNGSMRPTSPAHVQPPIVEQPQLASVDLLSLDIPSTSDSVGPHVQQPTTMGIFGQPIVANASNVPAFSSPGSKPLSPIRSTFKPTSSFGQGILSQHNTGSQSGSVKGDLTSGQRSNAADVASIATANADINLITQRTTELKSSKESFERQQQQSSSELKILRLRLSQLRSQFETEEKYVKELRQQSESATRSNMLAQQELTTLVEEHRKLQVEQSSLAVQIGTLKADHTNIKDTIRKTVDSIAGIRTDLEKKKNDIRTQTGLNSVLSAQISSNEHEIKRLQSELDQASVNGSVMADNLPINDTASVTSGSNIPATSSSSLSMNPFRRRTTQQSSDGTSRGIPSGTASEGFSPALSYQQPVRHQSPFETGASQTASQTGGLSSFTSSSGAGPADKSQFPSAFQAQHRPGSQNDSWSFQANRAGSPTRSNTSSLPSPGIRSFGEAMPSFEKSMPSGSPQVQHTRLSGEPITSASVVDYGKTELSISNPSTALSVDKDMNSKLESAFPPVFPSASPQVPTVMENVGGAPGDSDIPSRFHQYDRFEAEFPPIGTRADEDASSESSFEGGFDDNFTSAAPTTTVPATAAPTDLSKDAWPSNGTSGFAKMSPFEFAATTSNSASPFTNAQSGVSLALPSSLPNPSKETSSVFDDLKPALEESLEEPSGQGLGDNNLIFDTSFDSPTSSRGTSRLEFPVPASHTTMSQDGNFDGQSWPLSLGNPNSTGNKTNQVTSKESVNGSIINQDNVLHTSRQADDSSLHFPGL